MKCICKTQNGTRCSRNAEPNSKYCWQHIKNAPGPRPKKSPARSPRRNVAPGPSPRKSKSTPNSKLTDEEYESQRRYCSCVSQVKAKGTAYNAFAVCTKSVGRVTNSCKEFE